MALRTVGQLIPIDPGERLAVVEERVGLPFRDMHGRGCKNLAQRIIMIVIFEIIAIVLVTFDVEK